jgi:hypothetical protein
VLEPVPHMDCPYFQRVPSRQKTWARAERGADVLHLRPRPGRSTNATSRTPLNRPPKEGVQSDSWDWFHSGGIGATGKQNWWTDGRFISVGDRSGFLSYNREFLVMAWR